MKQLSTLGDAIGPLAGFFAFLCWGGLVLFWKQLETVPPFEVLCYRILCSLLFVTPVILFVGRWKEVRAVWWARKTLLTLMLSSGIVGLNWFLYIWAISRNMVLEASLGYYINPLVNVLLGFVFLGERPTRLQTAAIVLATIGVSWSVFNHGYFPWLAFGLAITFALYGLLRKTVQVESLPGLFWETVFLSPLAGGWVLWLAGNGEGFLAHPVPEIGIFLLLSGPVTSIPLILFAFAARHMQLMTLGLMQYVSPTGTFLIGVFLLHEPLHGETLVTFCFIWAALVLYTLESLRIARSAVR